jgi:hypothetical protein
MSEREDYADHPIRPSGPRQLGMKQVVIGGALVFLLVLGIPGTIMLLQKNRDANYATHKSIGRAVNILDACREFKLKNPQGTYPLVLADLLKPPFDMGVDLVSADKDLADY